MNTKQLPVLLVVLVLANIRLHGRDSLALLLAPNNSNMLACIWRIQYSKQNHARAVSSQHLSLKEFVTTLNVFFNLSCKWVRVLPQEVEITLVAVKCFCNFARAVIGKFPKSCEHSDQSINHSMHGDTNDMSHHETQECFDVNTSLRIPTVNEMLFYNFFLPY